MSENPRVQRDTPLLDASVEAELSRVRKSGLLERRTEELPTWCPGCGYYGINHAMMRALVDLGVENHNTVVVSGIGCAGRFPFFVNGYGFHCIHGRAVPTGCGVKIANPDLSVIVVGGDGDGLGIGGGHLPHAMRRNVDLTYILFDNGIYGLTKGQTSPTTPVGQITGTHPYGNPDQPLDPVRLALAYRGSFVARGWAGHPEELYGIFREAFVHRGFSFVVCVTPCVTFDKSNITYERMRDRWQSLPEGYDAADERGALDAALSETLYQGVFYREERPTFHDHERETAAKAGG